MKKVELIRTNYNERVMELKEKDGYYFFPFDGKYEFPMCVDDKYCVAEIEQENK